MSLAALTASVRFRSFAGQVEQSLGSEFLEHIRAVYAPFRGGQSFVEFAVAEGSDLQPEAFIERVASMSDRRFTYLALGRLYPENELPNELSRDSIVAHIRQKQMSGHIQHAGDTFTWVDELAEHRRRLVDLWGVYIRDFFTAWYRATAEARGNAVRRMEVFVSSHAAEEVFKLNAGVDRLPPELPPGFPYREVHLIPVTHLQEATRFLYGYGVISIPFGVRSTEDRDAARQQRTDRIVRVARALSDPARIRILEVIAGNDYSFNGHRIAWRVGLSKSVVSRHLKQLSEAGLIESFSPDNRSYLYRVNSTTAKQLSAYLLDALDLDDRDAEKDSGLNSPSG